MGKQWKQWETLFSGVPKSLQMVTAAMKLKDACSLEEKYDQPKQHIKKQRHYFINKVQPSQGYGFSSGHVWMWELDCEESCSVPSLSRVQLFVTPWITAHQASLSITISWSSLRLMSIKSMMPSSHLILCYPLLLLPSIFPNSGSLPMSQLFTSGGQSIGVWASASVLPMNTQDWSPLGWTGWISLQSKGLSRVFSNNTVQKHKFFCAQLSL